MLFKKIGGLKDLFLKQTLGKVLLCPFDSICTLWWRFLSYYRSINHCNIAVFQRVQKCSVTLRE